MTTPQDLPRQVRQNKNNIDDLFELQTKTRTEVRKVAGVQREHGRWLNRIEATQGEHGTKLDEILGILKKAP